MDTAIYSRKSVYSDTSESVEHQAALCREYIRLHYGEQAAGEAELYEDEGFSAKSMERPQLQRMLAQVEAGKIRRIVCYRLDRISRNVSDFTALQERLEHLGVEIICIREKFDTSTPMGKAMLYIASVFAQLERETISERVRDNMQLLAQSGRWLGGQPPYGYRSQKHALHGEAQRGKYACFLQEDPKESEVVRLIFRLFLQKHSLLAVAQALEGLGKRSRTGKRFSAAALRSILGNPAYCRADAQSHAYFSQKGATVHFAPDQGGERGIMAYNKRDYRQHRGKRRAEGAWIVAIGKHTPLVTGKRWVKVQQLLEEQPPRKAKHNSQALCAGKLYCGVCGERMFPKRRSGGEMFDYICGRKLRQGAAICSCRNLSGPRADAAVMEALDGGLHWAEYGPMLAQAMRIGSMEGAGEALGTPCRLRIKLQALPLAEQKEVLACAVRRIEWEGSHLRIFLQ